MTTVCVDKGVSLGETLVHTLGYADDIALIDRGDATGVLVASARATAIAIGSKQDADMSISIPKTKSMHVRAQDPISATTDAEASEVCKFACPHLADRAVQENKWRSHKLRVQRSPVRTKV